MTWTAALWKASAVNVVIASRDTGQRKEETAEKINRKLEENYDGLTTSGVRQEEDSKGRKRLRSDARGHADTLLGPLWTIRSPPR